jgi:hypothetical protein
MLPLTRPTILNPPVPWATLRGWIARSLLLVEFTAHPLEITICCGGSLHESFRGRIRPRASMAPWRRGRAGAMGDAARAPDRQFVDGLPLVVRKKINGRA